MKNIINDFKQQLIVELCNFIDEPNNRKTRRQMAQTVQDLNNKFNDEGRHITVDADLIAGFDDIQLTLTIMKGIQPCPDCGVQIISFSIE